MTSRNMFSLIQKKLPIVSKSLRRCSTFVSPQLASKISESSVCPKELDKFREFSYTWWDENSSIKLLNNMTAVRVELLLKNLVKAGVIHPDEVISMTPLKNINILDAGCGGGFVSEVFAKMGANVTGIDASPDLIRVAIDHMHISPLIKENLTYVNDTIESFANENTEKFDVVFSSEVIEHVLDKDLFAENVLKCLRPGGSAFFTTMNRTLISGFYYIFLCENIFHCIPKGAHEYDKFMTPDEMKAMFRKYKCTPTNTNGFTCNPISMQWFPVNHHRLNFAMHAIKNK